MTNDRKLFLIFLLLTFILLLRDTPYLNILVIDKLWIIYVLIIAAFAFFFIPKKKIYLLIALFLLLLGALILTFMGIEIAAEVIGIVLYAILWFIVLQTIFVLVQGKRDN